MGLHGVAKSVAEVADIVVVIVCDPFAGGAKDGSRLHGGGGFDLVRLACYLVVGEGRQLVSSLSSLSRLGVDSSSGEGVTSLPNYDCLDRTVVRMVDGVEEGG